MTIDAPYLVADTSQAIGTLKPATLAKILQAIDGFRQGADINIEEIGDGNINFVYRLSDSTSSRSVIVKHALPFFKAAGRGHPLGVERAAMEADALELMAALAPGSVPAVLWNDAELGITVMEDLGELKTMRHAMMEMTVLPAAAEQLAEFIAKLLFYTSDHASLARKKSLQARFGNPELMAITESLIFTDPYSDHPRNRVQRELRPYLERHFWPREDVLVAASIMKRRFFNSSECLLHGDLHTGSILVGPGKTKIFDPEFAFVGPRGFDIGKLIGNLLINYFCWSGYDVSADRVACYRAHTLALIGDLIIGLKTRLSRLLATEGAEPSFRSIAYRSHYLAVLWDDLLGFCATTLVRRMFGLAQNIDVEGIEDLTRRRDVQIRVLELAKRLLVSREEIHDTGDLLNLVRQSGA